MWWVGVRNTASVEEIASFAKRGRGNHWRVDIKLATVQERPTMAPQPLSKHALVERAGGELVLAILLHNLTSSWRCLKGQQQQHLLTWQMIR